ncbi:MAG: cyclic nucleotide-binding domain-containing protein [Treponema sp.]|jgi:CRP-like cAMP-binding protein|nr:cyclic nucleotide-binding domain-containing protein [Treponema sp.]
MPEQLQLSFISFKQGSYIIIEGKRRADRFFIIKQGQVLLSKEVNIVEEDKLLKEGDFFGVVSTMSSHSHIETARAAGDVVLISVMKEQYDQLIKNNSPIAMKIILEFSKRMRYLDEALTKFTLKNNIEDRASQIYDVGEYYIRQGQYSLAFYAYYRYMKHNPQGTNVASAREKMLKLAPHAKNVKLERDSSGFNQTFSKNTMIFAEGEPGQELFIIQSGSVKIVKIANNQEVLLAVLKTGDIFGEMALLESRPRAACAIAFEDTTLMVVNRQNFETMVLAQPQLVARLTTLLSERIWFIYKQLANTKIIDPLGRLYNMLLIQMEKERIPLNEHRAYSFSFGPRELLNMVGLTKTEGPALFKKMTQNGRIQISDFNMNVSDVIEIVKQAEFYHKMDKIEQARRETGRVHL